MATKYFCDGCGDEIKLHSSTKNKWRVVVENDNTSKVAEVFDLCEPCGRKLKRDADPRQWVRCAPPKVA